MGCEKVFLFNNWRKVYYDKKGEFVRMPTMPSFGVVNGTKLYLADFANLMGVKA